MVASLTPSARHADANKDLGFAHTCIHSSRVDGDGKIDQTKVQGGRRFKGVRRRSWGKWVAEIREPNKRSRIWLGSSESPEMAARAYDAALLCLRGKQASAFNFPHSLPSLPSPAPSAPKDIQHLASTAAASARPRLASSSCSPSSPAPHTLVFKDPPFDDNSHFYAVDTPHFTHTSGSDPNPIASEASVAAPSLPKREMPNPSNNLDLKAGSAKAGQMASSTTMFHDIGLRPGSINMRLSKASVLEDSASGHNLELQMGPASLRCNFLSNDVVDVKTDLSSVGRMIPLPNYHHSDLNANSLRRSSPALPVVGELDRCAYDNVCSVEDLLRWLPDISSSPLPSES